jgi:hypothetical protein
VQWLPGSMKKLTMKPGLSGPECIVLGAERSGRLLWLLFRQVMEQQQQHRQESLERRTSATGESPPRLPPMLRPGAAPLLR